MEKKITGRISIKLIRGVAWLSLILILVYPDMIRAQNVSERIISGKVTDPEGQSIPGVNIVVKSTSIGTITDADGFYSITINQPNPVLVFSFVGYTSQESEVGNQRTINISMASEALNLQEVVVTALGIKKEARTISYTTQEVRGRDLTKAREPNPINSLTGKIAGLTVGASAELLGRPKLVLRGSTDVLFVVDGVPINSDTWNISADDIETYTVLKGPNAAALYGFRGQNGAILITTKKGNKNGGLSVEFNSSTMVETGYIALPKRQSEYGFGNNFQYAFGNKPYDEDGQYKRTNIWGPRFEGQLVPQYDSPVDSETGVRQGTPWLSKGKDNFTNFMENGLLTNNNLSLSKSGDNYDVRASISHSYQKGKEPNTNVQVSNLNLYSGVNVSKKLRWETNLNFNYQNTPNIPDNNSGPEGYTYSFLVYGSSSWALADIKDYYKSPGKPGVQQYFAEYGRDNNPYFMAYEWLRGHYKTDIYGYTKLTYKINDFLNLSARTQVTTWNQSRTEKVPYSTINYKPYFTTSPDIRQGDYHEDTRNLFENNTDVLLSYDKNVTNDFHISAVIGGNVRAFKYTSSYATTDYLIVPGVYNLGNSKFPVKSYNFSSNMEVYSGYSSIDVSFRNFVTLTAATRVDKLSTLPRGNQTFAYPSVGLSTVVTDFIKFPEIISFLKLRGSYANVKGGLTNSSIGSAYQAVTGKPTTSLIGYGAEIVSSYDGPSYENQNGYNIASYYNGQPAASFSTTIANPTLEPLTVKAYEAGVDLKFMEDRIGVDVTHFTNINGPTIFALPVASSSGYYKQTVNGFTTQKKGWEVSMTGSILENQKGLNWDVMVNWSTYKETLKDIYENEKEIYLQSPDHVFKVGDRLDGYYGYKFLRSPEGAVVYSNTGVPLNPSAGTSNKQLLGYTNPDWVFGINNSFSYKGVTLTFQFDGRIGGVIYDQIYAYAANAGNAMETVTGKLGEARLKEWQSTNTGTIAPTPSYIGEGVVITSGTPVIENGQIVNSSELTFDMNTKATTAQSYIQSVYNNQFDEPWLISRSFVKLREVTIGYSLPAKLLSNTIFKSASIALIGRNLLYFAERKDIDLDQYPVGFSSTGGSSTTLKNPGLQTPTARRYGININLTF